MSTSSAVTMSILQRMAAGWTLAKEIGPESLTRLWEKGVGSTEGAVETIPHGLELALRRAELIEFDRIELLCRYQRLTEAGSKAVKLGLFEHKVTLTGGPCSRMGGRRGSEYEMTCPCGFRRCLAATKRECEVYARDHERNGAEEDLRRIAVERQVQAVLVLVRDRVQYHTSFKLADEIIAEVQKERARRGGVL